MTDHTTTNYEQVEPEGLNGGTLGVIVVGGMILILSAMFVVVSITELVFHDALVESTGITGYPTLTESRENARKILSSYAPIDRDAGIYRIPIDRAMDLIVSEAQRTAGGGSGSQNGSPNR